MGVTYVSEHESDLPQYFISAMNISAEQHVHVLTAAQRNVDNSCFENTATVRSMTRSSQSICLYRLGAPVVRLLVTTGTARVTTRCSI